MFTRPYLSQTNRLVLRSTFLMATVQCQTAVPEPERFLSWTIEDTEALKILLGVLVTCLAMYTIRPIVHAVYCKLSDSIYRRL